MNLLFAVNEEGLERVKETVFSVRYYNYETELNIFIFYDNISTPTISEFKKFIKEKEIGTVSFVKLSEKAFDIPLALKHTTKETYLRLIAPYFLNEGIDRILYLDYDVICTNVITDFYNTDFDGKIIVGVEDVNEKEEINDGVLLIDVKKYRNYITKKEIVDYVSNNYKELPYQSQSVINTLFKNEIIFYDNDSFNYQIGAHFPEFDYSALVHYSGKVKPWNNTYNSPQKALPYYTTLYLMDRENEAIKLSLKHFKNQFNERFDISKYDLHDTIDILMPSYNATSTIGKTLDSIIAQELGDLKVIVYLIDDCSQEDYKPIVEKYSKKLDIRYYRLEKNSGVALARQKGIDEGKSEYFTIIDSDDRFISPYAILSMYCAMKETNVDVVRSIFFEEKHFDYNTYMLYRYDNIACHGRLYRRKFIQDNNIVYLDMRGNEDTAYNALLKACDAKYYDLDIMTYRWCDNPNSFTRSDWNYHETDLKTYSRGFVWTTEEILKRKNYLKNIEAKIGELFLRVYSRVFDAWDLDTREEMVENTAKMLLLYRKYTNEPLTNVIIKEFGIEDTEDFYFSFLKPAEEVMYELDEYKKLTEKEKRELGALYLDEEKPRYEVINNENELKGHNNIKLGNNCVIEYPLVLDSFNGELLIGDNVKISHDLRVKGNANIHIDSNTNIEENVSIVTNGHIPNTKLRNYVYSGSVKIGNNVYIESNTIIRPSVTIGENAYIRSGSVVNSSISSNNIAGGNPCTEISEIDIYDKHFYDTDKLINKDLQ